MKQLLQNLKTGQTYLEEIPNPAVKSGQVLIQTTRSLVSLGTEKMLVEFGKAGFITKARQQPDKVKMVIDKVRTEGLSSTIDSVRNKLDTPIPLGYCNVGLVVETGSGVTEFQIGDRVISNGAHAEMVAVGKNLVASIPENVSDEEASFTVIGSIGLQGIRLLDPTIGETIVVVGLGLIGLISAQILKANGCRVIAYDLNEDKVNLAKTFGIEAFKSTGSNPADVIHQLTDDIGADGVLITASAKTNEIISQAAQMCRTRGKVVLVGVVGLDINRSDFYNKEISFQVSCSYGPGRYDDTYEKMGVDYPIGYVRWTEKRNFETILSLLSQKRIDVKPLITNQLPFEQYESVYASLGNTDIATIFEYSESISPKKSIQVTDNVVKTDEPTIGILGAGNFTRMTMLPALKDVGASIKYIASASGLSGTDLAKKYKAGISTTDYREILDDSDVNTFIITTQHGSHSKFVCDGLEANKHVFVEKPLGLNIDQLEQVQSAYKKSDATLMVGFNRRFSPHSVAVKSALGEQPMQIVATFNAGFIPKDVWVHDLKNGGGRIIGEACHFFDLLTYFTGSEISAVCMNSMGQEVDLATDNASILVKFKNGSSGVINYFSNGSKKYAKERIEIYSLNRTFVIDNFRKTTGFGQPGFKTLKTKIDKGHKNQFKTYLNSIKHEGKSPISFNSLMNTSMATIAALDSLKEGAWVKVK